LLDSPLPVLSPPPILPPRPFDLLISPLTPSPPDSPVSAALDVPGYPSPHLPNDNIDVTDEEDNEEGEGEGSGEGSGEKVESESDELREHHTISALRPVAQEKGKGREIDMDVQPSIADLLAVTAGTQDIADSMTADNQAGVTAPTDTIAHGLPAHAPFNPEHPPICLIRFWNLELHQEYSPRDNVVHRVVERLRRRPYERGEASAVAVHTSPLVDEVGRLARYPETADLNSWLTFLEGTGGHAPPLPRGAEAMLNEESRWQWEEIMREAYELAGQLAVWDSAAKALTAAMDAVNRAYGLASATADTQQTIEEVSFNE
ncbi:hypothetical protein OF83DRAFT_1180260, partial [Amylostereum chailletii]